MRNIALVAVWALVAGFAAVSCGEAYLDAADHTQQNTQALDESGGRIEALTGDPLFCPTGPLVSDTSPAAADADDDSALSLEDTDDAVVRPRDRIDASLEVREIGADHLLLYGRLHNGYRCDWRGHAFLEQEGPFGFRTVVRARNLLIPAGRTVAGSIIIPRPPAGQLHEYFLRAYGSYGGDRQLFYNCLLSEADGDPGACPVIAEVSTGELELADEVIEASFDEEEPDPDVRPDALLACEDADATDVAVRPPMHVDLRLRIGELIDIWTAWQNISNRILTTDLYVDVIGPDGLKVVRRDLGVRIDPGVGFCTWDQVRRPVRPGVYVFSADAYRRDGSAQAHYYGVVTTEITAVCNQDVCELIDPNDFRAELPLFGPSEVHLVSPLFSEFTQVWLEYQGRRFDITEYCQIEQGLGPDGTDPDLSAGRNHMRVKFNTFDLPIPRDTWGLYTFELHPMPPVPCGKWSDRLWILTNALPTCDPTSVSADGC